jgi:hypothetical protein
MARTNPQSSSSSHSSSTLQQVPTPTPPPPPSGSSASRPLEQLDPNRRRVRVQAQSVGPIPGVYHATELHHAAKKELQARLSRIVTAQSAGADPDIPNIMGIGIGLKFVEGRITGQIVIKVLVVKKMPRSKVPQESLIPEEIDGVPTDVHEFGLIRAQAAGRLARPVQSGCDIGFASVPQRPGESGTLGCLVAAGGKLCILSNNHVLARENSLKGGEDILQPGGAFTQPQDPADFVAQLVAGYPQIDFAPGADNRADAALAITSWALADPTFVGGLVMTPDPVEPALGLNVHKIGMRTGETFGQIVAAHLDGQPVGYNQGSANFNDMIIIKGDGGDFSRPGDSGSLIMTTGTNQPVGLLVAGGSGGTVACNISNVMDALGIERFIATQEE